MIQYDIDSLFIRHINSTSNIHKHEQTQMMKSIDQKKQIFSRTDMINVRQ